MSRALAIVLLLGALSFSAGLGRTAIGDSDEAFYAEAGREMIQSGDWLTPQYNFEHRFQKPILFYWLVAAAYLVAGVGEGAARIWSAFAGLILVYLAYAAARRWYDELSGLFAGLITATSFGYAAVAHLALPDLPLACFVTAGIYCGIVAVETRGAARSWTVAAGGAIGLACLTKGPVGIALPAMVLVAIGVMERRVLLEWRAKAALATFVAILTSAPWYVAMIAIHGIGYAEGFFVGDNLERFATSRFNEPRAIWFYLPILAGGMLPWSVFFPLWLVRAWRAVTRVSPIGRLEGRFLLWSLLPLLFFTVSIGKQPRYILPILPPLAILMGRTLAARIERARGRVVRDPLVRGCAVTAGALLVALGGLMARARPVLAPLDNGASFQVWVAIVMASGILLATVALRGRVHLIPWAVAIATAVSLATVQRGILAPGIEEPVTRMAALIRQHRAGNEPIGTYQVMVRNLVFYTGLKQADLYDDGQTVAFLSGSEPVLCVIGVEDLDRLATQHGLRVRRLGGFPYINTAALKIRTLVFPDPAEDITSAYLVTNQP